MRSQRALASLLLLGLVWSEAGHVPRVATAQGVGSIAGIVRPGAGGDVSTAGALVQLIELRQGPQVVQETRAIAGRFRFEIERFDPAVSYLVRAVVDGVGYLSGTPLQLSPQQPSTQVDVVVYSATGERPALRASISAVTIVAVDREAGRLTLQREDAIVNPSTRTWVGDADGVTLQIPGFEGTVSAEGQAWYDGLPTTGDVSWAPEGISIKVPFRPGETMVITRHTVAVDLAAPRYDVQLQAALPSERLEIMIPERFASRVTPLGDGLSGAPVTIQDERMRVVERSRPAVVGDVVAASVVGLAAPVPAHPRTQPVGAAGGSMLVLAAVTAAAVLASRGRSAREAAAV